VILTTTVNQTRALPRVSGGVLHGAVEAARIEWHVSGRDDGDVSDLDRTASGS